MEDEKVADGFNSGYFLAKEHPQILQTLLNGAQGNSEYLESLKAGQKEYEMEEYAKRMNEHQAKKEKEKDNDLGR